MSCIWQMLGFKQISVEPVVAQPEEEYALREEDIPAICEEYDRLAKEMIKRHKEGRGFNFFHFMIDLTGGPCVYKRLSGCGSGTEYLAVTPWGDFYPCHQFVGEEQFLMGNVEEGIKTPQIQAEFKNCQCPMQKKSAKTVLQNSTAAADVRRTPGISTNPSTMHMISDVNCSGSVSNARS